MGTGAARTQTGTQHHRWQLNSLVPSISVLTTVAPFATNVIICQVLSITLMVANQSTTKERRKFSLPSSSSVTSYYKSVFLGLKESCQKFKAPSVRVPFPRENTETFPQIFKD